MRKVCLIPCYNRPEFLYWTLDLITKADNYKEYTYLFSADYGYDPEILNVINVFDADKVIYKTPNNGYNIGKQSYNVLNGYIVAIDELNADLVCMIEDDVFIGKDFFTFHEQVHELESDIFCSILTKNANSPYISQNNLNGYYNSHNYMDYQSLGVCFKRDMIDVYIRPYYIAGDKFYFKSPEFFVKVNFPNSNLKTMFCEQDGLIRRIKHKHKLIAAFADVPRAYHAGFYGKNRGKKEHGTLEQRIQTVKKIAFSRQNMWNVNSLNKDFYYDSEPVNLDTKHDKLIRL